MPIKLGSTGFSGIYQGTNKIGKIYKGIDLVYQSYVYNPVVALIERTITNVDDSEILNIDTIGNYAFYGSNLETIELHNNIITIGMNAFENCINLKNIEFPSGLTTIGMYAFSNCESLEKIEFTNNITSIGQSSFVGCTKITSLVIPNNITSIGASSFARCTSLKSATLPTNISIIPSSIFMNCKSLETITIPSGVTEISSSAFVGCESLESMTILATTPPTITISTSGALGDSSSISSATKTIYVPASSVSAYQTAENWKDLMTRETNPVTFVGI
jgi:hypothetical protein